MKISSKLSKIVLSLRIHAIIKTQTYVLLIFENTSNFLGSGKNLENSFFKQF